MPPIVALWSHLLAAILYGALALFQLRRWQSGRSGRPLISAFAVVSVWSIFAGLLEPYNLLTQLSESARNLAFLAFIHGIAIDNDPEQDSHHGLKAVFAAVAAVVGLQIVVGGVIGSFAQIPQAFSALMATSQILGLTIAAGALILVHNLYGQAAPDSRGQLRYPMLALAGMWAFDLHLYTVAYFMPALADDLLSLRGLVLALLAPLFALGLRNNPQWKVRISRAATFQSVSVIAILAYLLLMMSAARAFELIGGDWGRLAQIAIVSAMTLGALVVLPSGRARAWLRVILAKHVFEHRYDYRREWLRFTDTVARHASDSTSLEERVIKALADIAGAEAGVLLLAEGGRRLSITARWNSDGPGLDNANDDAESFIRFVEEKAYVIDFDQARRSAEPALPAVLQGFEQAWAGVPLIHSGKLVGLVLLEKPSFRRPLDWEDFDLLRTAGRQAASSLAEAHGQQALMNAQRFEDFNRRFAFILHDVKNLVSQLSLLARNAERHADNADFRSDMVATLRGSVDKMNDLLARLAPTADQRPAKPEPTPLRPLVASAIAAKRGDHEVMLLGDGNIWVMADPLLLEQAIGHLIQNAVDASAAAHPVTVRMDGGDAQVTLSVSDSGAGMDADFVRTRLFQPFASTKKGGFGVGAFEAKSLIYAMGGRLIVESRPGEGSCFTITLPAAKAAEERKRKIA
jgi:putative PEP-CTERM system histidine kinase